METRKLCYAELRALPDDVTKTRTVEFVISNEARDRHGTVLLADKWKLDNYRKNPIVGYAHAIHGSFFSDPNPDMVIGKSKVYKDGTDLIGAVTFEPPEMNPLAEKIFQKVLFGSLRTASVGFIPLGGVTYGEGEKAKGGKNETAYFQGQELLEWSIVNIPSNPSAAKRDMADDMEEFMDNVGKALDGKYTEEDLRKMTVTGIINALTNIPDEQEQKDSELIQQQKDEFETKRQRELRKIHNTILCHSNFEKKIEDAEKEEKKQRDRQIMQMRRSRNRFNNND